VYRFCRSRPVLPIYLVALVLALLTPQMSPRAASDSYAARIEKTTYQGWSAWRLTNGIVSALITPQIGGRVIQLQLGDQEFFFVNHDLAGKVLPESQNNPQAGWADYGGDKVWPGPEGWMSDAEWASIPNYTLDGSEFKSEVVKETPEEVAFRVTSPQDLRTGVQFERTIHVFRGTTQIKVDQVMRNISRRQVRWGIWHLIQNDASDIHDASKPNPELYLYIPLNPHSKYPRGYYNYYGDVRHPSYELIDGGRMLRIHYLYRVGRVAMDASGGWFAVVNGQKNIAYVENFKYFPEDEYPDGASVESWSDGPGVISRGPFDQVLADDPHKTPYFMEGEVMSPYATLDPGEEYSFSVYWSPTRITNPVRDAVPAGAISEPLSGEINGDQVRLTGVFGVFEPGTLVAAFYTARGEELGHFPIAPVDPREVVRVDKTLKLPPDAFRVSVFVQDADGQNLGVLGNSILRPR
jgi:hypothetical protein